MYCNKRNKCKFSSAINQFIKCTECPYYNRSDNLFDFQGCFHPKNISINDKFLTIKQQSVFEDVTITVFFDTNTEITFSIEKELIVLHIIFKYHKVEFSDNVINYVNANNFSVLRIKYHQFDKPWDNPTDSPYYQ